VLELAGVDLVGTAGVVNTQMVLLMLGTALVDLRQINVLVTVLGIDYLRRGLLEMLLL
jgi:hypothetical protein